MIAVDVSQPFLPTGCRQLGDSLLTVGPCAAKNPVVCMSGPGIHVDRSFTLLRLNRGRPCRYLANNMSGVCHINPSLRSNPRTPEEKTFGASLNRQIDPTHQKRTMSNHAWGWRSANHSTPEDQIEDAIREVRRIADWSSSGSDNLDQRLGIARTAISTLNGAGFPSVSSNSRDHIFVISTLQKLAYHEADGEGVTDIADWCMNQWLRLLQTDGESLSVLKGLYLAYQSRSLTYIRSRFGPGLVSPVPKHSCTNTPSRRKHIQR